MKKLRILKRILQRTGSFQILSVFIIVFFLAAMLLWMLDPAISSLRDSLWYCFVAMSTIGFGDIVATTAIGKIITVILTVYGVFIVALIPGIVVSYYMELLKIREKESIDLFLEQLCRLPELSTSELEEISQWAKRMKK